MNEEHDRILNLKTALCTIGGIVVGTTALSTMITMNRVLDPYQKLLRGSDYTTVIIPSNQNSTKEEDPYEPDPEQLFEWAYKAELDDLERHVEATGRQSVSRKSPGPHDFFLPTGMSNDEENTVPDSDGTIKLRVLEGNATSNLFGPQSSASSNHNATVATSPNDTDHDGILFSRSHRDKEEFRLKLYWAHDYFWQEKDFERWWCMSCGEDGVCKKNEKMFLRKCNPKTDLDAKFRVIEQKKGDQLQIIGTDLCLQKRGNSRHIVLKPCENKPLQWFSGIRTGGESFELRPTRFPSRCLSNHHHPKAGEVVYAETCRLAHKADTGYWVAY